MWVAVAIGKVDSKRFGLTRHAGRNPFLTPVPAIWMWWRGIKADRDEIEIFTKEFEASRNNGQPMAVVG
jgi:hypothetical protein